MVQSLPGSRAVHPPLLFGMPARRMLKQFRFHGLRIDAAGYVETQFWPWLVNASGLAAWLETVPSPIHLYEQGG